MSKNIPGLYGSLVFNDSEMKIRLPKDVYKALKKTIDNGTHLELDVANAVAVAMKEWGHRARCYSFHSLVPAYDRNHSRKAR